MTPPKAVHVVEQLGTFLREIAPALGSYREALVEAGFRRDEAVELAKEMSRVFVAESGIVDR